MNEIYLIINNRTHDIVIGIWCERMELLARKLCPLG